MNCNERIHKFIASVCSVLQFKVKGYEIVFADIIVKKCLPILLYSLNCCMLNTSSINSVSQAWNMAFKCLYNLHKYNSTRLSLFSRNTMSMQHLLNSRIMTFYRQISCSGNKLLHNLRLLSHKNIYNMHLTYDLHVNATAREIKLGIYNSFADYCAEKFYFFHCLAATYLHVCP